MADAQILEVPGMACGYMEPQEGGGTQEVTAGRMDGSMQCVV